jgi:hypothetical protein
MQGRGIRRIGAALGAVVVTGAFVPSLAQADSTAPSWNCRSSIAYVLTNLGIPQLKRVEPFAANGNPTDANNPDRATCADDSQAVPHIGPFGTPIDVEADAIKGVTVLDPDTGAARDQTATAAVSAANVKITVGGVPIKVSAVLSSATVHCEAGVPKFDSTSLVAGLEIAGQSVPIQDGLVQLSTVIDGSPLKSLVNIQVGNTLQGGDNTTDSQGRIEQALKIEVLNVTGTPLATAVLGEAKVTRQGRACDPDGAPVTPGPSPNDPGTKTVTTPGAPTTPSIIYVPVNNGTTGSGTGTVIELNGQNGGCGKLNMYFEPARKKVASTVYGNRIVTRGRLLSCGGKPIVGGRVDVYHVIKGRKTRIKKTGVRSRTGGLITLILPLNLTTRKIVFEYRGNLQSQKITASQSLALTVRYKGKVITKEPGPKRKVSF